MPEMRGEAKIDIQATPEQVYEYVANFHNHIEWNHQPTEMVQTSSGAIGIGSTFRTMEQPPTDVSWFLLHVIVPIFNTFLGLKPYTEAEITALEPGKRVAWKAAAPKRKGYMMKAEWEILLTAQNGNTHVSQRFHFMPQHFLSDRASNAKLEAQIKAGCQENLGKLRALLEG